MADGGEEFGFVFLDFADERLVFYFFVGGGPENHFGEDRGQVQSFGGEAVDYFAAVGGVRLAGDNCVGFEFGEAVGQDIGGNSFVGIQKLLVAVKSPQHHVANNQ